MATPDPKQIAMGLGVLGILGGAVVGVIKITTPDEIQCQRDLKTAEVELAKATTRLELLEPVYQTCRAALAPVAVTPAPEEMPQ